MPAAFAEPPRHVGLPRRPLVLQHRVEEQLVFLRVAAFSASVSFFSIWQQAIARGCWLGAARARPPARADAAKLQANPFLKATLPGAHEYALGFAALQPERVSQLVCSPCKHGLEKTDLRLAAAVAACGCTPVRHGAQYRGDDGLRLLCRQTEKRAVPTRAGGFPSPSSSR